MSVRPQIVPDRLPWFSQERTRIAFGVWGAVARNLEIREAGFLKSIWFIFDLI